VVAGARALLDDFADFLGAGPDVTPLADAGLPDSPAREGEKVRFRGIGVYNSLSCPIGTGSRL
jgi:hypothetical protein